MFPHLAELAKEILSIQTTSTASERLFKSTGYVLTKDRCKLDEAVVGELVFIQQNLHLMQSDSTSSQAPQQQSTGSKAAQPETSRESTSSHAAQSAFCRDSTTTSSQADEPQQLGQKSLEATRGIKTARSFLMEDTMHNLLNIVLNESLNNIN